MLLILSTKLITWYFNKVKCETFKVKMIYRVLNYVALVNDNIQVS